MIVSVLIAHSHDSVVDWELQLPASAQNDEIGGESKNNTESCG